MLGLLAAAGVLDDFPAALQASLPDLVRARLAPELATLSLAYGDGDGGARDADAPAGGLRPGARGGPDRRVRGHLPGRLGRGPRGLRRPGTGPARRPGARRADRGRPRPPRQEGAARAVARAAPEVSTRDDGALPDLIVVTRPVLPDLADGLMRDRVPHLAAWAGEAIGVVGPLVRPRRSACLRCVDRRKADADPQWPMILAQATFERAGRRPATPCWPP